MKSNEPEPEFESLSREHSIHMFNLLGSDNSSPYYICTRANGPQAAGPRVLGPVTWVLVALSKFSRSWAWGWGFVVLDLGHGVLG